MAKGASQDFRKALKTKEIDPPVDRILDACGLGAKVRQHEVIRIEGAAVVSKFQDHWHRSVLLSKSYLSVATVAIGPLGRAGVSSCGFCSAAG
jgi:hypothetical protein